MAVSFLDCPHNNVQEYTECCLDCGYNIYTSREDYLRSLEKRISESSTRTAPRVDENDPLVKQIRAAERKLEIDKEDGDQGFSW